MELSPCYRPEGKGEARDVTVAMAERDRGIESAYAWRRLAVSMLVSTIGGVGMWSVVVTLPSMEAEFGVTRADATLPYTLTMLGVMLGGVLMGRVADRFGVMASAIAGTLALGVGYLVAGTATTLWQVALVHGVFMGLLGSSATFAPLIADISHWFERRRGIAVAIVACGSYLAGTIWPPVVQHLIDAFGWRQSYFGIGVFCLVTMLPLALLLRPRAPTHAASAGAAPGAGGATALGVSPNLLQALLMVAGVACCVAMAMPQVHIVAYCGDLGYGPARGAEMLSLMLGFGVVSRLASGWVTDRIGPIAMLLLGSVLQAVSLVLYLPFDGLASLYVISALFGLFQGGIVPSYAVIVRQHFPVHETGFRVGLVLSATLAGMALGGWMSGVIFDATGSYRAAFLNGIAWNVLNAAIAAWLLWRSLRPGAASPAVAA
jgi:MFS family permease